MINFPNILTALNMLSGICAILLAVIGRIDLAPFAILVGLLFDFFDGFVARLLQIQSDLGKQLDSLADMVTFGVAPGVLMFVVLTMDARAYVVNPQPEIINYDFAMHLNMLINGTWNDFVPFIAMTIPFFALFRLAKFNIDTRQSTSFIGLPTPANTLFFLSFPLMIAYPAYTPLFVLENVETIFSEWTLSIVIVSISLLQIIEIPLFALKFKSFGWKGNEIKYIFLLISIGLILVFKALSVALIVFLYVVISMINENLFNKNTKDEIQS